MPARSGHTYRKAGLLIRPACVWAFHTVVAMYVGQECSGIRLEQLTMSTVFDGALLGYVHFHISLVGSVVNGYQDATPAGTVHSLRARL